MLAFGRTLIYVVEIASQKDLRYFTGYYSV